MMINIDQNLLGRQSNTIAITRLLLHFTLNITVFVGKLLLAR